MTKKVLGFNEKDAVVKSWRPKDIEKEIVFYKIAKDLLVPVHLKSESVTVEWLEKEIKRLKIERYWDSTSEERAFKVLLDRVNKEIEKQ